MFGTRKGQGATEYLVLLAVVLIIALVSIALLGFFPGLAGDARKTQSDSYWRGEARPFQIVAHSCTGTTLTMVLQNSESDKRTLTNVTIGANTTVINLQFAGGEKKTVSNASASCGSTGSTYDFDVNMTYTVPGISGNQTEVGTKTLVGTTS
jgi:uncharacterized protein (UPF0333 family)